jgi:hypothetical protein
VKGRNFIGIPAAKITSGSTIKSVLSVLSPLTTFICNLSYHFWHLISWQDNDFFGDGALGGKRRCKEWKRLKESEGAALYVGGIEANDISQGALGDCYFLAALAALAEEPKRVESLFLNTERELGNGLYGVRWFGNGEPIDTWVDTRFPYHDGKPMFSSSAVDEMWVLILEKAFAKRFGSYQAIASGLPGDALAEITGSPVTVCNPYRSWNSDVWCHLTATSSSASNEMDAANVSCASITGSPLFRLLTFGIFRYLYWLLVGLWDVLYGCGLTQCPMDFFYALFTYVMFAIRCALAAIDGVCGGLFSRTHALLNTWTVGLVPGHAYSVLDVKGGSCTQLVKLRNPWGKTEWGGWYSDRSLCWWVCGSLKEDLGIVDEDDGSFWMHLNDFCVYFDRVDTCHIDPNSMSKRIGGKITSLRACVIFHVEHEDTLVNVQINQPRNGPQPQRMLAWRLRVVKSEDFQVPDEDQGLSPGYASQGHAFDCQKATNNMALKPGKYAILINCHPGDKKKVKKHVHCTVVLNSATPENIRFDVPGLEPANAI